MPSMDVVETTDKVCYHFDLPGISDKEQINLSIDTNLLRVNCEKPQICCVAHTAEERLTLTYHRHERSWGKYERYIFECVDVSSTEYHLRLVVYMHLRDLDERVKYRSIQMNPIYQFKYRLHDCSFFRYFKTRLKTY